MPPLKGAVAGCGVWSFENACAQRLPRLRMRLPRQKRLRMLENAHKLASANGPAFVAEGEL